MLKKLKFLNGLLSTLFYFLPCAPFLLLLLSSAKPDAAPFYQICILIFYPCLCPIILTAVKSLPLSLILSALAGLLFTGALGRYGTEYWLYGIFCALCWLSFSIKKCRKKERSYFLPLTYPVLPFMLIILCYFLFAIQKNAGGEFFCLQFFLLSIFLFLPAYYLRQYLDFIEQNTYSSAIMPKRRIFGSGLLILIIFSAVTFFLLLASSGFQLPWSGLLQWLAKSAAMAILWFFKLINAFLRFLLGSNEGGELPFLPESTATGTNSWLDVLISAVMFAVIIAGFLWLVYSLLKKLLHFKREAGIDKRESLLFQKKGDQKQHLRYEKKKASGSSLHFIPRDNNEKIRKLFCRIIRKQAPSLAPAEYAQYIEETQKQEQMDRLAFLYEKARYSPGMCTDEEVREAKEYLKKLTCNEKAGRLLS